MPKQRSLLQRPPVDPNSCWRLRRYNAGLDSILSLGSQTRASSGSKEAQYCTGLMNMPLRPLASINFLASSRFVFIRAE
eukprot:6488059-Amphidinium_carterae.1